MSVSAFPLCRRRDVVEDVVRGLCVPGSQDAQRFWRARSTALMRELVASGVPLEAAKGEVQGLLRTAFAEMRRQPTAGTGG